MLFWFKLSKACLKKFNLDIRILSEVTNINRNLKTISIKKVKTGELYEESYDTLILSPGARPIVPPLEGLKEAKNVFTLRMFQIQIE